MKKNTKKLGLLIVDDEPEVRKAYRNVLSGVGGHRNLKDIWSSIAEKANAKDARDYIRWYSENKDDHLLVISDAYMPPNCDGNTIKNPNELFGGLWLINEVNENEDFKEFVTILLVTFFHEEIKPYIMGNRENFTYAKNTHYFFVEKPYTKDSGQDQKKATDVFVKLDPEEQERLFKRTFDAIWDIIKRRENGDKDQYRSTNIIGQSESMQEFFESIHRVAPSKANVLLRGESGTGKDLAAKEIHYSSQRSKKPFKKINCASIPEGLLESELFGHEQGAFTGAVSMRKGKFELANEGTIFLDEIGDLPLTLQPKILRVLQEKEFERVGGEKTITVDVRLIAATNKKLEELVSEGEFRDDLYYRLNVVPIFLPPLRERKKDISKLVDYFLKKYNEENNESLQITPEVLNVFMNYGWPGNVRELENTIEGLVVMTKEATISLEDATKTIKVMELQAKEMFKHKEPKKPVTFDGQLSLKETEKEYYKHLFEISNQNKSDAARIAEVKYDTVKSNWRKYGLCN